MSDNEFHPVMQALEQAFEDLGFNNHNMERSRPYSGQPHTCTGVRGATEIKGVTFRDLRDCFIRAVLLSTGAETIGGKDMRPLYEESCKGERAALCENDLYGFDLDKLDPMAICQNLCCEIERIMGIYPNVPELTADLAAENANLRSQLERCVAYSNHERSLGAETAMMRVHELEHQRDALLAALDQIAKKDRRSMYERCLDCDYRELCSDTKACRDMPLSEIGKIAEAAIAAATN